MCPGLETVKQLHTHACMDPTQRNGMGLLLGSYPDESNREKLSNTYWCEKHSLCSLVPSLHSQEWGQSLCIPVHTCMIINQYICTASTLAIFCPQLGFSELKATKWSNKMHIPVNTTILSLHMVNEVTYSLQVWSQNKVTGFIPWWEWYCQNRKTLANCHWYYTNNVACVCVRREE